MFTAYLQFIKPQLLSQLSDAALLATDPLSEGDSTERRPHKRQRRSSPEGLSAGGGVRTSFANGHTAVLFTLLSRYLDVFHSNATHEKLSAVRDAYIVHILNHVFKCKDVVLGNTRQRSMVAVLRDPYFL